MASPYSSDTAMRRDIRSTLKANSTASFEVALGNWRYREGGTVTSEDAQRFETIYTQEYAERGGLVPLKTDHHWWRFW